MPTGQWTSLTVRSEIKQGLYGGYIVDTKRPMKQKFGNWLDNLLTEIIDHDKRVRAFGALLEAISYSDNHVLIKDNRSEKHFFVEIATKNGRVLYCQEDASDKCLHVGFAMALPRVYKALIDKGYEPPQTYKTARSYEKSKVVDEAMDRVEEALNNPDSEEAKMLEKAKQRQGSKPLLTPREELEKELKKDNIEPTERKAFLKVMEKLGQTAEIVRDESGNRVFRWYSQDSRNNKRYERARITEVGEPEKIVRDPLAESDA